MAEHALPEESWHHPDVEVGPSAVAGRGLFATADLPAGTVVSRPGGRVVDAATARAEVPDVETEALRLDGDAFLVLPDGNLHRFVNHACDPTLGWTRDWALATRTDVAAGGELLVDYAMSVVEDAWFLRCHCASYRCRQMVEGSDWRIPQLQQRYDGWWSPYVTRLLAAG